MNVDGAERVTVWKACYGLALRVLRREPGLGLKRMLLPVSYWRTAEFAYAYRRLPATAGARVLDLGSPKEFSSLLARHRRHEVVVNDILPEEVAVSRRYARAQALEGSGPGHVSSEVQDGRCLSHPSSFFDAAYAISVLEHIPDRGDSVAISELVRVVKPGGVVVVTTPYAPRYRESFVDHAVYERRPQVGEKVFWERHYDDAALESRLFAHVPARVIDLELWGERRFRVERLLERLGAARTAISPIEPLLSIAFLHRVASANGEHPMAVFFTLKKCDEA